MHSRCLTHLTDASLDRRLVSSSTHDCINTADLLADMAESDARRRFAALGYPSMAAYCQQALRMSKQTALKRIRVARLAHQFPVIYDAIADRRLHVCAVILLAPHLKPGNAGQLLPAAFHRTEEEIELMLAERFPCSESMTLVTPMTSTEQKPETEVSARTLPAESQGVTAVAPAFNRTSPVAPGGSVFLYCMVDQEPRI